MPHQSTNTTSRFQHLPVLAHEFLASINNLPEKMLNNGLIIDATLGGGGHCELLLEAYSNLNIIGLDQDPTARAAAAQRLALFGSRVKIIETNFADFTPPEQAIAVLADLGVSSPQLDNAERGFSFRFNGPLDMRMNPKQGITAAELIQEIEEAELANLIYKNGEERFSRKIARKIKTDLLKEGPYQGTLSLAYAIAGCYPPKLRHGKIHPATRTFQALRIAVNNELEVLDKLLIKAPDWIKAGGLLSIISFHSLEDRRVKKAFLNDERLERITKKPLRALPEEIKHNPRSRSAKYRVARRKLSCGLLT
ncbi:16S rRNA (cytosine(1402)-N(4))-methyltransferase RsmH [Prochlorococcus sp. MIT 1307]|uniref:16S rRNA (cytosine(1402)-N(4))-methyltransferase RsmH n=1 Tax=Prochlorococcus sp. MIT 1307 TaxID=3096219 RepID=UPI002A758E9C|nr:16S rRNA (cytosine(1402)-N(4))-methyltransferase RsmH [Prochlorococcus sp. MIT 1307]